MSEKFTPGPWHVSGVRFRMNGGEWMNISRYNEILKKDEHVACIRDDPRTGEGFAAAKFIATAPDLYAALKDCLEFIEANVRFAQPNPESGEEPADRFSYEAQPICSAASAALKKARGEE